MDSEKIESLKLNHKGYLEFEFNNITYFILEGVLSLKGKAQGFSSECDAKVYFINKPMPNNRLKEGLEHAKKHYLKSDFSIKKSFTDEISKEIYSAFQKVNKSNN